MAHRYQFGFRTIASAVLLGAVALFVFVDPSLAQTAETGSSAGFIVARIVQFILGFLGLAALSVIAYGGYLFTTAEGVQEQEEDAKKFLLVGGIAFAIILLLFIGITVVIRRMTPTSTQTGTNLPGGRTGLSIGGEFPLGAIDSHYPDRDQNNVPRNTSIIVSFLQPLSIATVINQNGTPADNADDFVNLDNVKIFRADADPVAGPFVTGNAAITDDQKIIFIRPVDLLGSETENTDYRVILGEGIRTADGSPIFGEGGSYDWGFQVGTFIDNEPPQLESFIPVPDSEQPRNVVIQMNFTEAMNPITVSGDINRGFDSIAVRRGDGDVIIGRFIISNQFKTVEFLTTDICGTNACGEDVFCLPGNADINVDIRAASLSLQPPTAAFPFDGVTDAASNSLDGNKDNASQGAPEDSVAWSFSTSGEIDTVAPVLASVNPLPYATLVPLDQPITATFSKPMLSHSINRQSFRLTGVDYRLSTLLQNNQSTVTIDHAPFGQDATFTPSVTSDVKDIYQNCYRPCVGP